jgi:uncharacterized membrane protein
MEIIMTKIQSGLTLTALALTGAFLALPLLVGDAKASTTSKLMNCRYDSRQKVMDCCQRVLRTESKPYWISSGAGSCSSVVKCVGGGKKTTYGVTASVANKPKRCFVAIPNENSGGRNSSTEAQPEQKPMTPTHSKD